MFLFMLAEAGTPHICLRERLFFLSLIPTKQGGLPTSEGCILTSEGVFLTKQAILREIKGLFCTYQHVANTKFARKRTFCPKNDLFWRPFAIFTLTQPIYPVREVVLCRRHPACDTRKTPGQDAPETRRLEACDTRCRQDACGTRMNYREQACDFGPFRIDSPSGLALVGRPTIPAPPLR
jgi:hypothetical protein